MNHSLTRIVFLACLVVSSADAQEPEWIWHSESARDGDQTVYLRKTFRTPPFLWNSRMTISSDDEAEVFLNGVHVATSERWERPVRMEVTVRLHQGENAIGICARNRSGAAGVLVHLRLGEETTLVSDSSWLVSTNEEPGWNTLSFSAAHWLPATSLGRHGIQPWGDVLQQASATSAESLSVPPGFEVELLRSAHADEGSWICLTADGQGRLIVSPQERNRPLLRFSLDGSRLSRVQSVAEPLRTAMGLLWTAEGLYANAIGPKGSGLYRLRDLNGNDHFDPDEIQFLVSYQGGGEHGYHALRRGPDGTIYILNGNGTRLPPNVAPRSAHQHYAQDVLGIDARSNEMAQPAGYVLRGDPDQNEWELWMGGLRNSYDFDFNADGELFIFDSDSEWDWGTPWYRPTRIVHAVSGAEFGFRDNRGMWPDYYDDSLPAVVNVGIGSPTGVEFGTRSRFPEKYRRALFAMDWSYGRILAIHFTPHGASYRGTVEPFLEGTPLNVTDLTFGPDGAMYFITGGRGTQSGLYRVRYRGATGGPAMEAPAALVEAQASAQARALRHRLERFHGRQDPLALDFLWAHLGSRDRFIRYAARIALECQELSLWRDRALNESNLAAGLTALLALARVGSAETQAQWLTSIQRFPLGDLDQSQRLLYYRALQVSFTRHHKPDADLAQAVAERLSRGYPSASWPENRELARLLAWLGAHDVIGKSLDLLESAPTQEQQLHYIEQLRLVRSGWTLEDRRRYFSWWNRSGGRHPSDLVQWFAEVDRRYVDGPTLDRTLSQFRADAIDRLTERERAELESILRTSARAARTVPRHDRSFVREWTLADLLPHVEGAGRGRNFERGRQAFVDAQCLSCHRFGNDGGSVAPELTAAGQKYDRRFLLESILEPSKAINEQYQNTTIALRDGESITGRLSSQSGSVIELETNPFGGGGMEIPRERIASMNPALLSPMPGGLINILTRDEIFDLLAYLESGGDRSASVFASSANRN